MAASSSSGITGPSLRGSHYSTASAHDCDGLAKLRAINPHAVFGPEEWRETWGMQVGEVPPVTDEVIDSFKKYHETHLLVMIPRTVNGDPLSLRAIQHRLGHLDPFVQDNYQADQVRGTYWTLVPKKLNVGSLRRRYEEHLDLAKRYHGNDNRSDAPSLIEAVVTLRAIQSITGKSLAQYDAVTETGIHMVCQEDPSRYYGYGRNRHRLPTHLGVCLDQRVLRVCIHALSDPNGDKDIVVQPLLRFNGSYHPSSGTWGYKTTWLRWAANHGASLVLVTGKALDFAIDQDLNTANFEDYRLYPQALQRLSTEASQLKHLIMRGRDLTAEGFQAILEARAIEKLTTVGDTPLLTEAVDNEDVDTVRNLMLLGVNPNIGLPLHLAVHKRNLAIVELLLEKGAEPNRESEGTALHRLRGRNENNLIAITERLLAAGADPRLCDRQGFSPLHHAWASSVVDRLLEAGADPHARTHNGETPLHFPKEVLALHRLLLAGVDPNAKSRDESTPLHTADESGALDNVRQLVAFGATVPEDPEELSDSAVAVVAKAAEVPALHWLCLRTIARHHLDTQAVPELALYPSLSPFEENN